MRAFSFLEFPVANCLQLKQLIFEYARRNFVFGITFPDWMFFLHVSIRTRAVYCTHFSTGHKGLIWLISIWPTLFVKFLHCILCFQTNIYPALPPFLKYVRWSYLYLCWGECEFLAYFHSILLLFFFIGLTCFINFWHFSGMHVRAGINKRRTVLS